LVRAFESVEAAQPTSEQRAPATDQATNTPTQNTEAPISLLVSVCTDKPIYRNGERVRLTIKVFNPRGDLQPSVVDILINRAGSTAPRDLYKNLMQAKDGPLTDDGYQVQLPLPEIGDAWNDQHEEFEVRVGAISRDGILGDVAITSFAAEEVGWGCLVKIFVPPLGFVLVMVAACLWISLKSPGRPMAKLAILVLYSAGFLFLLLALTAPLLVSLSPGTEALFRTTPVGVVKVAASKAADIYWAVNIGGVIDSDGTLKGGFAVPLYVLILSVVGAVISMLLELPAFLRTYEAIPTSGPEESKEASKLSSEVFKYFVYILTGPFLGMIVYSLASLLSSTNAFVLSILSFSVGFISDGVVETMVSFSTSLLNKAKGNTTGGAPNTKASSSQSRDSKPTVTPPSDQSGGAPP